MTTRPGGRSAHGAGDRPQARSEIGSAWRTSSPTITDLAPRLARGEREIRSAHRRRARDASASCNPTLNAFITVTADEALAARAPGGQGDRRRPLPRPAARHSDLAEGSDRHAGVPTTAASRLRDEHIARRDAPVTARLREAGAVFVGKTNLHEFAFGTTNEDSGWGPARHPIDPTRSPGGSSGGSAIAVRTGMSLASVGTDTGGSIRIPAAACGIVGLKPGWGEISADGVVPLSRQLDHVGPLARSVADAALLYDVLRGAPPAAMRSRRRRSRGVTLRACSAATSWIASTQTSKPAMLAAVDRCAAPARASRTVDAAARAATSRPSICTSCSPTPPRITPRRSTSGPHAYTPNVRLRLEMGRHVLARGLRARAARPRGASRARSSARSQGVDALILPALVDRGAADRRGDRAGQRRAASRCATRCCAARSRSTSPAIPAISLPCGTTPRGPARRPADRRAHRGAHADLLRVARGRRSARSTHTHDLSASFIAGNSGSPTSAATSASSGRSNGDSTGCRRTATRRTPRRSSVLRAWVDAVMEDTDAFFTPAPTSDYTFTPRSGGRGAGEAGTLTFPSALDTPHPENNIVHARFFPARERTDDSRRAVVVLPQWNSDAGGHIGLSQLLARLGITALRLSLPYHDRAHAAGAHARRLHRQLERRAHRAGVPAGGARRAARAVVAARSGLRAPRAARHEPRIVPRDADRVARAAGARAGAQSRVAVLRRRRLARAVDRRTCATGSTVTSTLETLRELWRPISPWSYLERAREQARRCSCTRSTT